MATQFITNNKGEKTAVIIPISEYEDLLHQHHLNLELTDEYKSLMDSMIDQEDSDKAEYVSFKKIKDRFLPK
jgi:PHD/YefM family antitoxin component YafN of YafNO toxin-antitoxin module